MYCWQADVSKSFTDTACIAGSGNSFDIILTARRMFIRRCGCLTLGEMTNLLHKCKYLDSQIKPLNVWLFGHWIPPRYLYTMLVWCQRRTLCEISCENVRQEGCNPRIVHFYIQVSVLLVKVVFNEFSTIFVNEIGRDSISLQHYQSRMCSIFTIQHEPYLLPLEWC